MNVFFETEIMYGECKMCKNPTSEFISLLGDEKVTFFVKTSSSDVNGFLKSLMPRSATVDV